MAKHLLVTGGAGFIGANFVRHVLSADPAVRITNLDPKKKDLPGEVFTVANEHLGTVRKFVPYGEVTDNGYHVPYCIYKALKARKFLNIRTFKDRQNQNQIKVEQSWAQEFALEVLPTLTPDEIKKLAAAQSAAGGLN